MLLSSLFRHGHRPLLFLSLIDVSLIDKMGHVLLLQRQSLRNLLLVQILSCLRRSSLVLVHLSHQLLDFWDQRTFVALIYIILDLSSPYFPRFRPIVLIRWGLSCSSRSYVLGSLVCQILWACFVDVYSWVTPRLLMGHLFNRRGSMLRDIYFVVTSSVEAELLDDLALRSSLSPRHLSLRSRASVSSNAHFRVGSWPTSLAGLRLSSAS